MKTTGLFNSLTVWVNILALVAIIVPYALEVKWIDEKIAGIIMAVVNLALRIFKTDSKITVKNQRK